MRILLSFLLFLFVLPFAVVNACDNFRKDYLHKWHYKMGRAMQQGDEARIKKLQDKLNKVKPYIELCDKINEEYHDMRSENDVLKNAYASLSDFAYLHFDSYPNNADLLSSRLDVYARGISQSHYGKEDIVSQACRKVKSIIEIDKYSQNKKNAESPEEMYTSVRDLCDNDKYLSAWSHKSYILRTLARGFEEEGVRSKLHELFDRKN